MTLKAGDKVPHFSVPDDQGHRVTPEQFRKGTTVFFFYPKDDTPGCTKESCEFRDLMPAFRDRNIAVYGISADDTSSHQAFRSKYDLNFPLLADTDRTLCRMFGVWGMQEWKGKTFEGIARTTFVINSDGVVDRVYDNVNPVGHADEVLKNCP